MCKAECKISASSPKFTKSSQADMEKLYLSNNPITYALAQLAFPKLFNIDKFVPEIQDKLRLAGFPLTQIKKGQQVRITEQGVEVSEAQVNAFLSLDKQTAIILHNDSLVIETSNYKGFEAFRAEMFKAIRIIDECMKIVAMERIGIRFVNLIDSNDINDYLANSLHGVEETESYESIILNYIESRRSTGDKQELVIKLYKSISDSQVPEDLSGHFVKMSKSRSKEHVTALLDIDHMKVFEAQNFDETLLMNEVDVLHNAIYKAFRRSVTEKALEAWK